MDNEVVILRSQLEQAQSEASVFSAEIARLSRENAMLNRWRLAYVRYYRRLSKRLESLERDLERVRCPKD